MNLQTSELHSTNDSKTPLQKWTRRNFLATSLLALLCTWCKENPIVTQPIIWINHLQLKEAELKAVQKIQQTILAYYGQQADKIKNKQGVQLSEINQELSSLLLKIGDDLRVLGVNDESTKATWETDYIHSVNKILARKGFIIVPSGARIANGQYVLSIMFSEISPQIDINPDIKNIWFLWLKSTPAIHEVRQTLVPDIRFSNLWPYKEDAVQYGQTMTSSTTGIPHTILIYPESITKKATIYDLDAAGIRKSVLMNELANVAFRDNVALSKLNQPITDKITYRHLAETFSDYASLKTASKQIFFDEVKRIIRSRNPHYLLSKSLVWAGIADHWEASGVKDLDTYIDSILLLPEDKITETQQKILSQFENFPQMHLAISGQWNKL